MRRRTPERIEPGDLPPDLARGPDPRVWAPGSENPRDALNAWQRAGNAWSTARGLGGNGWLKYLHPHVQYVVHSLGRFHVSRGGLIPPWADGYNPDDYESVAGMSLSERGWAALNRDDGTYPPLDD